MANFIQDVQREAEEIAKRASTLRSVDFDKLARLELGPLNFVDAIPVLKRSFDLLLRAASVDLYAVPAEFLRALRGRFETALNRAGAIRTFNPSTQSARERDSMISSWANEYREDYDAAMRCMAAAPIKIPDFSVHEKLVTNRLAAVEELEKRFSEFQAASEQKISSAVTAAREAAAGSGIAQHATHFEDEAIEHRNAARWWLAGAGVFAGITLIFGLGLANSYVHLVNAPGDASTGTNAIFSIISPPATAQLGTALSIQLALARLIMFSILYVATIWCGRNFKAHKHNQVMNRHRQLALRTFEAFNNSTADAGTRNAVLLQTTAAIFATPSTGFTGEDGDGGSQPKIIELIKSVTSSRQE